MDNKQRDILLNAIKYLNIPLFYPGLKNAYVLFINIKPGSSVTEQRDKLIELIGKVEGSSWPSQKENSFVSRILNCKLYADKRSGVAEQPFDKVIRVSSRLNWIDVDSKYDEKSVGQLVLNPNNITSALKSNNLEAKEISVITQDMTDIILGIT